MFINKEGKLFGKISIIDVIVILAVMVIGIGGYLRFFAPNARLVAQPHEIEYVMRVHAVRRMSINALQQHGLIADMRTGEELGEIVNVTYEQAYWEIALIDGDYVSLPVPDRYNAIVTVRVDGRVSGTEFLTHQNRNLAIGTSIAIESKYASTSGEIIALRIAEDI